ncbi:MAG: hypothetical protein ABI175_08015 [Polyangiales bacterium]
MSESPPLKIGPSPAKPAASTSTALAASTKPQPKLEGKGFGAVLRALGEETRKGERLMKNASAGAYGKDLAPGDLLALQAGVYRYVEVVDLASKLVDRVTQGAKQLVQGGGQ